MSELLETWYFDSGRTVNLITEHGTASKTDATAQQLRDGSILTADRLVVSGDGIEQGLARKNVDWFLGAMVSTLPVQSIDFVRVWIQAEVTGDPGSTAVIYLRYNGVLYPVDDYLSAPIGALMWVSFDYATDFGSNPWTYTSATIPSWGFQSIIETYTENDTNIIRVTEARVELWGIPTGSDGESSGSVTVSGLSATVRASIGLSHGDATAEVDSGFLFSSIGDSSGSSSGTAEGQSFYDGVAESFGISLVLGISIPVGGLAIQPVTLLVVEQKPMKLNVVENETIKVVVRNNISTTCGVPVKTLPLTIHSNDVVSLEVQ